MARQRRRQCLALRARQADLDWPRAGACPRLCRLWKRVLYLRFLGRVLFQEVSGTASVGAAQVLEAGSLPLWKPVLAAVWQAAELLPCMCLGCAPRQTLTCMI